VQLLHKPVTGFGASRPRQPSQPFASSSLLARTLRRKFMLQEWKSSEFPNVENLAESLLRANFSDSKTRAGKSRQRGDASGLNSKSQIHFCF
jgi:hypothetical protein